MRVPHSAWFASRPADRRFGSKRWENPTARMPNHACVGKTLPTIPSTTIATRRRGTDGWPWKLEALSLGDTKEFHHWKTAACRRSRHCKSNPSTNTWKSVLRLARARLPVFRFIEAGPAVLECHGSAHGRTDPRSRRLFFRTESSDCWGSRSRGALFFGRISFPDAHWDILI